MCGEHVELEVILFCSSGSSPHVRGALWWPRIPVLAVGIIPACAGSTRRSPPPRSARRDHPRMCGEHKRVISFADSPAGSSPHVRGARRVGMDASVFRGIIPACAGSTGSKPASTSSMRDHPRMCGEHRTPPPTYQWRPGSSPHVRGAHIDPRQRYFTTGIIPACAGSTNIRLDQRLSSRDHPRMCGEHAEIAAWGNDCWGSSPHVRGARCNLVRSCRFRGIIPACAGSTWTREAIFSPAGDHPRMCGEHAVRVRRAVMVSGSSPHVRGAHHTITATSHTGGIIPACAGSTCMCSRTLYRHRDHPRMCGEHASGSSMVSSKSGSSPHVRGAQQRRWRQRTIPGIIPACAGSTLWTIAPGVPSRDHPRMCGEHSAEP